MRGNRNKFWTLIIIVLVIINLLSSSGAEDEYEALRRQLDMGRDPRDYRANYSEMTNEEFSYVLAHAEARSKALKDAKRYESWRAWMMSGNLGDDSGISLDALIIVELALVLCLVLLAKQGEGLQIRNRNGR